MSLTALDPGLPQEESGCWWPPLSFVSPPRRLSSEPALHWEKERDGGRGGGGGDGRGHGVRRSCSVLMSPVLGGVLSRPTAAPELTPGALLSLGRAQHCGCQSSCQGRGDRRFSRGLPAPSRHSQLASGVPAVPAGKGHESNRRAWVSTGGVHPGKATIPRILKAGRTR